MFLDWLFGRKPPKKPPRPEAALSDAALLQLNSELLQPLGMFQPGQAPIVYSPVQTRNRWSRATLAHEDTHQNLTTSTAYGALYQMLAGQDRKGTLSAFLPLCLRAQWGTQEGTASYVQMAYIAIDDPGGFDEAVGLLPTATLGRPPYREWFDRIERLLPLAPTKDTEEDLLRISDQVAFAVALGSYAMSSGVLAAFSQPPMEPKSFEDYLALEGPDIRLTRLIEHLTLDPRTERLQEDFRSICTAARAGKPMPENQVQWLMRAFSILDTGHSYVDNATRMEHTEAFFRAWSPTMVIEVVQMSESQRSSNAPIAEVKYLPDWAEKFPHAFAGETLTIEMFRSQLSAAQKGRSGLACSISMFLSEELNLTTMPYPRGADINPSSWKEILDLLKNPPTTMNVLETGEVLAAFEAFPNALLWIDFIRSSWRVWDRVAAGRDIFRNTVQTCFETELTEQGLRELLCFRDLAGAAEYVVFRVHGEQYAACFWDPGRPGLYALQGVAGDAGLYVFERLTERLQLRRFPGQLSDLPHALLIRLAGQGFLL